MTTETTATSKVFNFANAYISTIMGTRTTSELTIDDYSSNNKNNTINNSNSVAEGQPENDTLDNNTKGQEQQQQSINNNKPIEFQQSSLSSTCTFSSGKSTKCQGDKSSTRSSTINNASPFQLSGRPEQMIASAVKRRLMAHNYIKNKTAEIVAAAATTTTITTTQQGATNEESISNSVDILRQNMREELLNRLNKTDLVASGGGTNSSSLIKQSPEIQIAFAKRLEELLFKTSKSINQYSDSNTLNKRLQNLLIAMKRRKEHKSVAGARSCVTAAAAADAAAALNNDSSTRTALSSTAAIKQRSSCGPKRISEQQKRTILLQVVGQSTMTRIFKVVAEIKLIQLGREVTEGKPYESVPNNCTHGVCSFSVPCQGDQRAPQVVRDLFFNTAIVPALEKSSPEQLRNLPWDQLLKQGETRLASYHVWYKERQANTPKKSEGRFHP